VLRCAAEVVVIGNDARALSTRLTNQMAGVSSRAILMTGRHSTVRHSAGVLFGFIVGFSASPPPSLTGVRLQVWRPRQLAGGAPTYQLACQRQVAVPDNVSQPVLEVSQLAAPSASASVSLSLSLSLSGSCCFWLVWCSSVESRANAGIVEIFRLDRAPWNFWAHSMGP